MSHFHIQLVIIHISLPIVRPKDVSIISKREPLSSDKSYWLECKTFGSRPPAIITWWKGDKFVGKTDQQVIDSWAVISFRNDFVT